MTMSTCVDGGGVRVRGADCVAVRSGVRGARQRVQMLYTRLGQRDGQRVRCAEEDVERAVEEAIVRIERLGALRGRPQRHVVGEVGEEVVEDLHGARAEARRCRA